MPLDKVIFPKPFRLEHRDASWLEPGKRQHAVTNFQVALFESAQRAASRLHAVTVPKGQQVLRAVRDKYTYHQARSVPPNSSQNTGVRWSGLIAGTKISRGALYTSQDSKGFLNEAVRYSRTKYTREIPWSGSKSGKAEYIVFGPASQDYKQLLVGQVYYTYEVTQGILLAELTPSSSAAFYSRVEADPLYQAAKRDLRVDPELSRLVCDPVDYIASRPVGLSVLLDGRFEGLRVTTVQNEIDVPGGGYNLVLGGDDGKEIPYLHPSGQLIAGISNHRPALLQIDADGNHPESGSVFPGSVLRTSTES